MSFGYLVFTRCRVYQLTGEGSKARGHVHLQPGRDGDLTEGRPGRLSRTAGVQGAGRGVSNSLSHMDP